MGNTKIYTLRCPFRSDDSLLTKEEISKAARSSLVAVNVVGSHEEQEILAVVESSSMSADNVIDLFRTRYPKRWMVVTRFDADWPDFRVYSWMHSKSEKPDVVVADNFREEKR